MSHKMKRQSQILLLSLAICSLSIISSQADAGSKPYIDLRNRLIHEGWKPSITNLTMADGTLERDWGDAKAMVTAGFVEVESCTGTGLNYCIFDFKKRGSCLSVTTKGEYDASRHSPVVIKRHVQHCH
jgi:hypothetical protein